jgi:hypothetical protein
METINIEPQEECVELKNIIYKTMLLNGVSIPETKSTNNLLNIDKFLEDEKKNNVLEPWSKLDKTHKTKKIIDDVFVTLKRDNNSRNNSSNNSSNNNSNNSSTTTAIKATILFMYTYR